MTVWTCFVNPGWEEEPYTYQDGSREIASKWKDLYEGVYGYDVGEYDLSELVYETQDSIRGVIVDFQGRYWIWVARTATIYLLAGADLLIMRHPEAVRLTRETIDRLMGGGAG